MKRRLVPFLFLFVLILSACGGSSGGNTGSSSSGGGGAQQGLTGGNPYIQCPSSTNTTAAAPESGNITLNVAGATSSPAEDALVQQNLKKFEQAHPNIK
ncbi:MAG: ABC transporter substrate-binding protein, partial [Chloroflexota bacterium]|nr:ABC transporter substrate-binding protein [Chloroflexota bacterium]